MTVAAIVEDDLRSARVVSALRAALGDRKVLTGSDIPVRNGFDATLRPPTPPVALVLAQTTADVSTALRICHEAWQPVVTQGGMTGLAGGAHPSVGEVAISLERLRGVEEVDAESGTLTALAGTPLAEVQAAAEAAGFHCGIDLGARGSCTIGGNVATNAGGNQVLRYGMARRNVLGLEAVEADGTVLTSLNKMLKNNTGYDWTQLFIGSEGTLGVITRVVLGLHPKPGTVETALIATPSIAAATALLRRLQQEFGGGLLTFEGMWGEFIDVAVQRLGLAQPFPDPHEIIVLAEIAPGGVDGRGRIADVLGACLEEGAIADAILAQSSADAARLWAYRESPYEYGRFQSGFAGFDISIPRPSIAAAVEDIRAVAAQRWPNALNVIFGHLADCNLHLIVGPTDGSREMGSDEKHRIEAVIYPIVGRHRGSVSAEHGIGRVKRDYLGLSRTPEEIHLMRRLKAMMDPRGILNPQRIL